MAAIGAEDQVLKPGSSFEDCAAACPDMAVIPAGSFIMGSPTTEAGGEPSEMPQHTVTISKSFAVSKFETTFAEWDVCAAAGAC
jgi:formylglycine-generating enzyme required for sulfatase activity